MSTNPDANVEIRQENEKDLLLSNLMKDDYFKLKLDEEVRIRTQAELNSWWKRLVGIVGIILSIIAVFGIKEYLSFKSTIDEAKQGIEAYRVKAKEAHEEERRQFAQSSGEVAELLEQANVELSRVQGTALSIKEGQAANDTRLNQQLNGVISASGEFNRKFGAFSVDFERTQNDLRENSRNVATGLENAKVLLSKSNDVLESMKREREEEKSQFKKEVTDPIETMKKEVKFVKDKALSSGSFIIKERLINQEIQTDPEDSNQDLLIDVGRLHVDHLFDFRVTDRRGKLLYDNKDLKIGEIVKFDSGRYTYTLTARYILRITFGSDAAGIDISWVDR